MAIKFSCPACGKQTQAPDEMAGKQARCPICKQVIDVPQPAFDPDATAAAYQPAAAASAPAEDEGRMPCPMCGEMIVKDAAKCRYCGEIFDPELRKSQKKIYPPEDRDLSVLEYVVAILCSHIGCILGIVYLIQGKPKGTKMFVLSLIVFVVVNFLWLLASAGGNR